MGVDISGKFSLEERLVGEMSLEARGKRQRNDSSPGTRKATGR